MRVAERVGIPLFKALVDYDSEKFDAVVDRLLPVKYEITDGLLSGSRAQVLCLFLLCAHQSTSSSHLFLNATVPPILWAAGDIMFSACPSMCACVCTCMPSGGIIQLLVVDF